MELQARLNAIYQRIEDSLARESWREARQGLRELARLLVDATIASDNEQVALIDELVAQVFSDISLDDAFQSELTLNSVGWSADGLREVSQLAKKRRPPMTSAQRAVILQDAETRILALLGEGNGGPRSNREIADRLELNVATVARTLGVLRARKKVRSWPEGRFMMNELASVSTEGFSIRDLNARAISQDVVLGSKDAKERPPRNPAPDQSAIQMSSKQQATLDVDLVSRLKQEKKSFSIKGNIEQIMGKEDFMKISALPELDFEISVKDLGLITNNNRVNSTIATNHPSDTMDQVAKLYQMSV